MTSAAVFPVCPTCGHYVQSGGVRDDDSYFHEDCHALELQRGGTMNYAQVQQLDELEPATQRSRKLEAEHFPRPGRDGEQRAVFVEIWNEAHNACLTFHFVLHVLAGKVFHVTFQRDWRVLAEVLGYETGSETEMFLETAAIAAFARGGR